MPKENFRILLIDDNPGDRVLIEEMLRESLEFQFKCEWVDQLQRGIDKLLKNTYDIILLDLNLPDSSGFETFVTLNNQHFDLPIIVLTGLEDKELGIKAVREGCQDYLTKRNLQPDLLVRSINYAIERNQLEVHLQITLQNLEELVKDKVAQLILQDRLAVLGRLAGSIAHDINNPLQSIAGATETIIYLLNKMGGDLTKIPHLLTIIENGCERIKTTINRLSQVTGQGSVETFNISEPIRTAVTITRGTWKNVCREISFKNIGTNDLKVQGIKNDIAYVFTNLIMNAAQAIQDIQDIGQIQVKFYPSHDNLFVLTEVEDTGSGIPPEVLNKLGNESVTTKKVGEGAGLSLLGVYDIIRQHRGEIVVKTQPGKGTIFKIKLPLVQEIEK